MATERNLQAEFAGRARAVGLEIDCLGSGNPDSEIVIVSEAAGEREAAMKMPMVGGAGQFLWTTLQKEGISRKDCYVTNVVKRQVSLAAKADAKVPVLKPELEHWEGLLEWELDQLPNAKYILILGNMALQAILGESGIINWRGSVVDISYGRLARSAKAVITFNPAFPLREPRWEAIFKFDCNKLRRVIDGSFKKHPIQAIINPSADEAIDYLGRLSNDPAPISFDIETMANETACVGFANNAHSGMCINFRNETTNRYTLEEERRVRQEIQRVFNSGHRLIAQNGTFDSYWLWYKDRIRVPKVWFDTLLAHHTLYPRMLHNLGFLTAQYTDHPYYKDDGKTWREDLSPNKINQFWEYNVKDCCITWAVHRPLLKELRSQKLEDFFFSHVMRLQPHLIRMTVGGILVDREWKKKITEELEITLQVLEEEFYVAMERAAQDTYERPGPNESKIMMSPVKLKHLFFDILGLKGHGTSTDETNRTKIKAHPGTSEEARIMLNKLDRYKEEQKFYSTYATTEIDEDGRMRCEYKQFGTQRAPGRLSSSSVMWGTGANMQNQPHRAYPMYIADPGYQFSYFDLAQAEAKVVAWLWNVRALKENFIRAATEEGFDIHRGNAARIFQTEYSEIPKSDWTEEAGGIKRPTRRYLGKRCVHGLNYRMQAPKLAEVCQIPIPQAYEAYASYHRVFPEISEGWESTIDTVKKTRQLWTPMGRRMVFMERLDSDEALESVIAFVPQSTIGDKVSSVIYLAEEDPEWPDDARMLLNVHDALVALHRPDDGVRVRGIMKKYAEAPIMIRGEPVQIFTELKHSTPGYYADLEKKQFVDDGIHRWSGLAGVEE